MPSAARFLDSDHKRASLPVSLLLTAFGAVTISFFYLGLSVGPAMKAAGAASGAYYSFLLFMILRSGKPDTWRRVFFVSIALFFFPQFIGGLIDARGHMTVDALDVVTGKVPYCHIVSTMTLIPMAVAKTVIFPGSLTGFYASIYSMLTIWLVASMVLGRGWCGWMCFYGGWDDLFSRTRKRPLISLSGKETAIRRFNQAMFAFIALASMYTFMAVYCVWFCPFKIVTEYEAITGIGSYLAAILFICLFVGLVVVMPALTRKRFQCSAFCPMAALQSLVDRVTPFGLRIDREKCVGCMACVKACPTLSLDEGLIKEGGAAPRHNCVKCGACVQACPKGAVRFAFRPADFISRKFGLKRPEPPKGRLARRALQLGRELLDPRNVFAVTAFVLGTSLSFTFAIGTLTRVINLILKGSFTQE
jgi:polyferredoxin